MSDAAGRGGGSRASGRSAAGDASALETLMDAHWAPLIRYVRGLASADGAEDIAQETFVRMWERRRRWKTDDSVAPLLYRIARNLALNEIRRTRTHARLRGEAPVEMVTDPADELERSDVMDAVRRALDKLSPRRRAVFVQARFNGLSYQEIAELLDISPQTVANHMSAALAHLRDELRSTFP